MVSLKNLLIFLVKINLIDGLKYWIQNTGVDNPLNWNGKKVPQTCDSLRFPLSSEIATYWNIKDIALRTISLPKNGEILFSDNINLRFRDDAKCSEGKDLTFLRSGVKGWLDGDNWRSEFQNEWLPHSERVPCAGEEIRFPSNNTIAVQLPTILLPINNIRLGDKIFASDEWSQFLISALGFELFKGFEEVRNYPWRTDNGCSNKKKCTCIRFPYTIRDGLYKEVDPLVFQKAICLYAMPKCPPANCYAPVVPEGHCCGICGAVLKLEDQSEDGYDLNNIKSRVKAQLLNNQLEKAVQTYVGRTRDGNVQIVIVADNSHETINSHVLANEIFRNLTDYFYQSQLTSHFSGLSFFNYLFNNISGIIFGTLVSVIAAFAILFYFYVDTLYKKFNFGENKSFVFAIFDNTLNEDEAEENLEIGIEPEERETPIQAFDNPIYSECLDINSPKTSSFYKQGAGEAESVHEKTSVQEYHNLIYDETQRPEKLNFFDGNGNDQENENDKTFNEFSEIKL